MSGRKLALWLGIAAAAMLFLCGLGVVALAWVGSSLGGDGKWTVVHAAPPQFHVKTSATDFHFREMGFQDPHYELIFEVTDVERFLSDNTLKKGLAVPPATPDAPVKPATAIELEGFVDDQLYRSGQLWQVGDKTYVYLVAFGT